MARVANASTAAAAGSSAAGPTRRRTPLNPAHVATLLGMRWKLTLRGFARSKVRSIVGLIVMLVFLGPFIGLLAFATERGYVLAPHQLAVQLLFGVLAILYLVWIALPLLQYTLNEGLDVTRLQTYPITRPELMVSLVLATLFDLGTLGLIVFFVPIVLGWSPTPAALAVTVVALVLAYVHTIGISQLVLAALMGLLRSRRYRDVSIVVFALLGATCSVAGQFVSRILSATDPAAIQNIHVDRYLQYTPPGMAARAIELAASGSYAAALAWLAVLAALVPVLLGVWAVVLERGITIAESGGGGASGRRAARRRARAEERQGATVGAAVARGTAAVAQAPGVAAAAAARVEGRRGLFSPAALAIAAKDARYLWRDPQLKASLLSSLFILVFVLLPTSGPRGAADSLLQPIRVLYVPLPTLIVAFNLSLNALGLERQALQMLYLFPVRPLDVFWGKNLTVGAISVGAQVVLVLAVAIVSGGWFYVPLALVSGLAAVLVLMGAGNVTSVLIPFRVREMRMGRSSLSSENGCLRSVLAMLALGVSALLLLPVAAAVGLPLYFDHRWLLGSLPGALLWGIGLYQGATRLIAPQLLARAPEILAATTRE